MIVELQNGAIHPPQREAYCIKSTAVKPGGDCPLWRKFLAEITRGDVDLQAYLQRVAGYCLTGLVTEEALFFCYGTGQNGKSVFINTLASIWGDYALIAPMEMLLDSKNERHPTEIARLDGVRLVIASETEASRRWSETKIKQLTGGDKLTGHFMRQDYFDFDPQFKLLIAGNHKPQLRNVIEATRRRINMIPFNVTIAKEARDKNLKEKLKSEWPGILQWAIDGCTEWQRIGLAPPPAVIEATETYLVSQDAIGNWIDERCHRDPKTVIKQTTLFQDWQEWATAAGEIPGKPKDFYEAIEGKGFTLKREAGTGQRRCHGLALKPTEPLV